MQFNSLILTFAACAYLSTALQQGTVIWSRQRPTILNETAQLTCHVFGRNCCSEETKWTGGRGGGVISFKGKSADTSKYIVTQDSNSSSFTLYIKKMSLSDIGVNYTCFYGFLSYTSSFLLNENDFELHPSDDTTDIFRCCSHNVLTIHVRLQRIYPRPMCAIHYKNEELTSHLSVVSTPDDHFFKTEIKLKLNVKQCDEFLVLSCLFGQSKKEIIKEFLPFISSCQAPESKPDQSNQGMISAILILLVVILIWIFISSICSLNKWIKNWRQKHKMKTKSEIILSETARQGEYLQLNANANISTVIYDKTDHKSDHLVNDEAANDDETYEDIASNNQQSYQNVCEIDNIERQNMLDQNDYYEVPGQT